jgi:hypothetical protein
MERTNTQGYIYVNVVHVQVHNVSLVFLWINSTIQGWIVERLEVPVRPRLDEGVCSGLLEYYTRGLGERWCFDRQ